jgi:serine/threonine-protein kinase
MIGSGGMGEVYRATDQKLGRDVALKFLPEEFTNDHARLSRFEREAQLLAQLHHPNIASIFGLEESNGVRALAMELVAGPTLDERLEQRPMPLEESLSIAQQIAEAVEAAHAKGIIHRDLKPQNIKLTEEGIVKVLDFGLAKAMETSDPQSDSVTNSTESPTMTTAGTMQGMILGSAPYMSPEQAKGHAADERADVWSFGVVLYEMLSGQRLFTGDSVPDTLAGVLRSEIHFDKLPESTPAGIRQLLRRCLQRKRKQRLHHIADARLMIEDAIAGVDEVGAENSMASATGTPRRSALWPVAVVIVAPLRSTPSLYT